MRATAIRRCSGPTSTSDCLCGVSGGVVASVESSRRRRRRRDACRKCNTQQVRANTHTHIAITRGRKGGRTEGVWSVECGDTPQKFNYKCISQKKQDNARCRKIAPAGVRRGYLTALRFCLLRYVARVNISCDVMVG